MRFEDVLGFVRNIVPPSIGATISGPTEHSAIRIVFSTKDVGALSARSMELGELAWPLVFSVAASLSVDLDALIDAGPTLDLRNSN